MSKLRFLGTGVKFEIDKLAKHKGLLAKISLRKVKIGENIISISSVLLQDYLFPEGLYNSPV